MNYSKIYKCDIANGLGFRVTLFVSGCARNCPGCFNKNAQSASFGKLFDEKAKSKIFAELQKDYCAGLSILGGEPMSKLSDNRRQIINFAKEVKEKFPDKTIWMWSGYTFDELFVDSTSKDIFNYVDVLVDGPFEEDKKDLSLHWVGSSNQHVIDVKERIKAISGIAASMSVDK